MCAERNGRISVLIVEDHPIFREALEGYVDTRPDQFELVGAVETAQEALALVQEAVPDIVLLDLSLPDRPEQGIQATREIRDVSPGTQVVILTYSEEPAVIFQAIQAGAVTYLLKRLATGQQVLETLRRVQSGDPPIDQDVARHLWNFFQSPPEVVAEQAPLSELTPREQEVLDLISEGKSNKEIAEELVISYHTVKKHVSNILSKLHLQSRRELQVYKRTTYNPLRGDLESTSE